ncbi:lytic murein transglycosylase [Pseudonocardia sp. HH130630-07]|nr:lytic murein transglycosylase [Pseudonocardia sp. HH130630-07]
MAVVVVVVVAGQVLDRPAERSIPVDRDAPPPPVAPLEPGTDPAAWARSTAERAEIPERTLSAYANAELRQRDRTPECGLSWSTLAGIGRVESGHARFDGAAPDADGRVTPPIIGIPLDGTNGTRRIPDTDGGRLDGDPDLDRAVGPMQFLPGAWERYGADGDGDGTADPHQIDDAALAAAGLLCRRDGDLTDGADWWDAVLGYNTSSAYARDVWSAAARYAQRTGIAVTG